MSDPSGVRSSFSRLSLRAKGVAVLFLPLTALFVALFAIYGVEKEAAELDRVALRAASGQSAILRFQVALAEAREAAARIAAGADTSAAFDAARASMAQSLSGFEGGALRQQAAEAIRLAGELRAAAGRLRSADGLLERWVTATAGLRQQLTAAAAEQDRLESQAASAEARLRQQLMRIVVACGVLGPAGGLLIHLIVAGRLAGRLRAVEENARRLAHGFPLAPFPRGSDEVASLAQQLEDAAFRLREREREVQDSENRYRNLFDRAPIAYEETDAQGIVRRFNQEVCHLLRCPPHRVLGRKAWDFVVADQRQAMRTAMLERIATGSETGPFESDFVLDDGTTIRVEVRESLIRSDNGGVAGVCRSLLDVTERNLAAMAARKVAEYAMELRTKNEQLNHALEAARSATAAKSRFLASVSHELRTPLNGIIGFSELMFDGRLGPVSEEHRDIIGDILNSARHLLQLINDILDLSKVEAGKMEFFPESFEIDTVVQEVRDVVRPLAEKKLLAVSTDVPGGLEAYLDRSRLKQVLYNYLSNAVKFTPPGGRVDLRVSVPEQDKMRIEVEDTGMGIMPEEMAMLFQDFQQLPNSRKAGQGTGLGLALTRHIVEAQGGKVAVRSLPGRGSVFSAILPIHAETGAVVR